MIEATAQMTPAAKGERIAQLKAKGNLWMAEQTELDRLTGDEVIDVQAELAESGRIVELEAAKAPVGSTGRLKVQAAQEVQKAKEKKGKFAPHFVLHADGTWHDVPDAASRDEWAETMRKEPGHHRMFIGHEITPKITIDWA